MEEAEIAAAEGRARHGIAHWFYVGFQNLVNFKLFEFVIVEKTCIGIAKHSSEVMFGQSPDFRYGRTDMRYVNVSVTCQRTGYITTLPLMHRRVEVIIGPVTAQVYKRSRSVAHNFLVPRSP